jgi:hypothetical protein
MTPVTPRKDIPRHPKSTDDSAECPLWRARSTSGGSRRCVRWQTGAAPSEPGSADRPVAQFSRDSLYQLSGADESRERSPNNSRSRVPSAFRRGAHPNHPDRALTPPMNAPGGR